MTRIKKNHEHPAKKRARPFSRSGPRAPGGVNVKEALPVDPSSQHQLESAAQTTGQLFASGTIDPDSKRGEHTPRADIGSAYFRRPGRPLSSTLERSLRAHVPDATLSAAKLHDDREADIATRSLGANALTIGRHIALSSRAPSLSTRPGLALLAHELHHTNQPHDAIRRDKTDREHADAIINGEPLSAEDARALSAEMLKSIYRLLVEREVDLGTNPQSAVTSRANILRVLAEKRAQDKASAAAPEAFEEALPDLDLRSDELIRGREHVDRFIADHEADYGVFQELSEYSASLWKHDELNIFSAKDTDKKRRKLLKSYDLVEASIEKLYKTTLAGKAPGHGHDVALALAIATRESGLVSLQDSGTEVIAIGKEATPKEYDKHAAGGMDNLENQSRELRQASIKHRTVDDKYLEPKKRGKVAPLWLQKRDLLGAYMVKLATVEAEMQQKFQNAIDELETNGTLPKSENVDAAALWTGLRTPARRAWIAHGFSGSGRVKPAAAELIDHQYRNGRPYDMNEIMSHVFVGSSNRMKRIINVRATALRAAIFENLGGATGGSRPLPRVPEAQP